MRLVKKGSTNVSVDVYIIDSTDGTPELGVLWNTAGMDLEYRREGAAVVNITEATLAALTTAHTDGGFLEIGHGLYRLDVPDAAFATGAETVSIQGTVTGMIVLPQTLQLVDFDPEDGVRLGLTALPNAAADAAAGLPISDAGGLDLDAKLANTNEVTTVRMAALTDWINGGRLDLLLDAVLLDTGTTLDGKLPAALVGGRMDSDIGAKTGNVPLSAQEKLDANVEADTALTDYDAPTKAEMDTAHALLATPAQVNTEADTALTDFFTSVASLVNLIWNELISEARTAASYGQRLKDAVGLDTLDAAKVGAITEARLAELDDSAGKLVAVGDLVKTAVDAIKLETDKLTLGDAGAGVAGSVIEEVENVIALLPTALVGGRIDASVDGTGMEAAAIDAILQRVLTEGYNADGSAPTLEQALMGILQSVTEFSISGTTITVKKLDGSTVAMTFTLDDATNPTSRTRAT